MKVNITKYGLRPFKIKKIHKTDLGSQYQGEYKLPKGTKRGDGKKWIDLDYWFELKDIKF